MEMCVCGCVMLCVCRGVGICRYNYVMCMYGCVFCICNGCIGRGMWMYIC